MTIPLYYRIAIRIASVSGTLSMSCSTIIVYMMVSDRELKLKKPNNRFLLAMSIIDIIQSMMFAICSMPVPRSSGIYGAIGNDLSCSFQGFFIQLGLAVPCYNASLCIWYLKSIKYNMTADIFKKKIEPYCHALSILLPLISAICLFAVDMLKQKGYICWIESGSYWTYYSIALLATCFFIIIFCLGSIYHFFWAQERQMQKYTTSPSGMQWRPHVRLQSRVLATRQASLFSFAFCITFLFPGLIELFYRDISIEARENDWRIHPLVLPHYLFLPLQGVWNFIIYARPTIKRIRTDYPELSFWRAFQNMICHPDQVRPIIHCRRRSSLVSRQSVSSLATSLFDRRGSGIFARHLQQSNKKNEFKKRNTKKAERKSIEEQQEEGLKTKQDLNDEDKDSKTKDDLHDEEEKEEIEPYNFQQSLTGCAAAIDEINVCSFAGMGEV